MLSLFACFSLQILLTEKRQLRSDAALREGNALLKSVFEGTGDAIFVKDAEGRYLIANKQIATFYGKPMEDIIGKTAFEFTNLQQLNGQTQNSRRVLESG